MSGSHTRSVVRASRSAILAGAGVTGLLALFATAPIAEAAPAAPTVDQTDSGATTTTDGPSRTTQADVPNYGLKKIRVGVQQKDGSYVPRSATTVGTKITITQTGGPYVGPVPIVTHCVTGADTRIDGDAASASFCDFNNNLGNDSSSDLTSNRRLRSLSKRLPRAITKPVDEDNPPPSSQAYPLVPGATVVITQSTVNSGYVTDPASPVTLEPCEDPLPTLRVAAAAAPSCDPDQVILEDGGLPPLASNDSATTGEGVPVTIAIAPNDTPKAPVTGVKITRDATHGTARLVAFESNDPEPSASSSDSGSSDSESGSSTAPAPETTTPSTTETTIGTTTETTIGTTTETTIGTTTEIQTLTTTPEQLRRLTGTRTLAAVTSYRAIYTPKAGFVGTDRFAYAIATDNGTATATVTVKVTGSAASAPGSGDSGAAGDGNGRDPLAETGTRNGELVGYAGALLAAGGGALAMGQRRRRGRHAR